MRGRVKRDAETNIECVFQILFAVIIGKLVQKRSNTLDTVRSAYSVSLSLFSHPNFLIVVQWVYRSFASRCSLSRSGIFLPRQLLESRSAFLSHSALCLCEQYGLYLSGTKQEKNDAPREERFNADRRIDLIFPLLGSLLCSYQRRGDWRNVSHSAEHSGELWQRVAESADALSGRSIDKDNLCIGGG